MNFLGYLRIGLFFSLCAFFSDQINANDEVECLVFSGNSPHEESLPLSEFNKIKITSEEFIITSSDENIRDIITLPYSDFNRLEFKNSIPTISAIIESLSIKQTPKLRYDSKYNQLTTDSNDMQFTVMVISSDGKIMLSSILSADKPLSIEFLSPGLYIAVAKDRERQFLIKFMKQ